MTATQPLTNPVLTNPVWIGQGLVAADDARVHVADHGFTVGDGVFETIAVRGEAAMALDRHIARLVWSSERMGMRAPEPAVVKSAVTAVIAAADEPARIRGRIRVTWTSGLGPLGSARGDGPGTLVVFISAAAPWPAASKVAVSPWARNERSAVAGVKSTSYAENAVALEWARTLGVDEALLLDTRGFVCEGTGSNILISVDGRLVTPALSTGCLAGIARALVLELVDLEEVEAGEGVLETADGLALLSSTRDVHPVSWLRLRDGRVREFPSMPPLIEAAHHALDDLYARNTNP